MMLFISLSSSALKNLSITPLSYVPRRYGCTCHLREHWNRNHLFGMRIERLDQWDVVPALNYLRGLLFDLVCWEFVHLLNLLTPEVLRGITIVIDNLLHDFHLVSRRWLCTWLHLDWGRFRLCGCFGACVPPRLLLQVKHLLGGLLHLALQLLLDLLDHCWVSIVLHLWELPFQHIQFFLDVHEDCRVRRLSPRSLAFLWVHAAISFEGLRQHTLTLWIQLLLLDLLQGLRPLEEHDFVRGLLAVFNLSFPAFFQWI